MVSASDVTVPDCAVVSSHTQESAGMVASLKDVTSEPVVVLVVVVPLVLTSLPAALRSGLWRTVHVTLGVLLPTSTAFICVTVIATSVNQRVMSSALVGLSTSTVLKKNTSPCSQKSRSPV